MIKRPAFMYYGGKFLIAPWIISYFPTHNNYLEPCGGAASVLLQKPKAKLETFNDIDHHVCNFFQVLRNKPNKLINLIKLTPWSREEFDACRNPSDDPIENARRFYCSSWMAISKKSYDKTTGFKTLSYYNQCFSKTGSNFTKIEYLRQIAKRFEEVQIENREAEYVIKRYDREGTLIYFDPPYVKETRTVKNHYHYDVGDDFHIKIADILKQAKGYVIISGYNCKLYEDLYKNWKRIDKEYVCNSGTKRIESIWLSDKTMKALNRPSKKRWGINEIREGKTIRNT